LHQYEWLGDPAYVPPALVLSWCLFWFNGVPQTHDGMGIVFIEAFRRSYLAGDYFPLWSVFGEGGHGSPFPALYHRLHVQLAALLALKTGTIVALKASIPFWLVVGGIGMRRLCRSHGVRPWVAWMTGVLLMAANYTVADWYIRGATAEFVGFMLVPWGLRYAYELLDRRWGVVRLAIISALLMMAHMMTFYFFVVTSTVLIGVQLLRIMRQGWRRLRGALGRCLALAGLLLCTLGPYAAAVSYVVAFTGLRDFGMVSHPDPWKDYLANSNTSWSRTVVDGQMTLEIGRWFVFCFALFLLLAPGARRAVWQRTGSLVIVTIAYVLLLHVGMGFWFDLLPGASKIQFPARLLVFIDTATLLCMAIAIEGALRDDSPFVRLLAGTLPLVATVCQVNIACGNLSGIWDHHVERAEADKELANDTNLLSKKMAMYSDWVAYLPRMHGTNPPVSPFLKASDGCHISSATLTKGAAVGEVTKNMAGPLTFTVLGSHCSVTYNQVQSTFQRVEMSKPGSMRQTNDGLTLIEAPDGTVVQIHDRSVLDLARKFLIQRLRRFP
jgi:hypothetical protein